MTTPLKVLVIGATGGTGRLAAHPSLRDDTWLHRAPLITAAT